MRRQLTVHLEEEFYLHIQKQAEERKESISALIREKLEQSSFSDKVLNNFSGVTNKGLEKLMLGMNLQILGLTRFLVMQINEDAVKEAMEKSDKVIEDFFGPV